MIEHAAEVASGNRFTFGDNWAAFLEKVDESRIAAAENSLRQMLEVDDLRGQTFLDIGSGSGLFSLAARRLGATVRLRPGIGGLYQRAEVPLLSDGRGLDGGKRLGSGSGLYQLASQV
jgi:hypothetical protein